MSGYIDLQVNGYGGVDFNADALSDEAFVDVCRQLRSDSVESFLPTIITDDLDSMVRRISRIAEACESIPEVKAIVGGIHVEGPFISPVDGFVGAHPREHAIAATVDSAMRLVEAGRGLVRLVTLAPEVEGTTEVTERLTRESILVAGGHSDASLSQLKQAVDAGLAMFTHLGNGCAATVHRHDNIVQRVLSLSDQIAVSFIADGHHVPWFALDNYLRRVPDEHIIIVTDAITAAGLGPGLHRLAGQVVEVDANLAAWAEGRKHFAGCATTMPQMDALLRNELGVSTTDIERWTHSNPARLLGGSV